MPPSTCERRFFTPEMGALGRTIRDTVPTGKQTNFLATLFVHLESEVPVPLRDRRLVFFIRARTILTLACSAALATLLLPSRGLGLAAPGTAREQTSAVATAPQRSPHDWAVLASNNEIGVLTHAGSYLRYRTHVVNQRGDRIRDVIESKDGTVARTLLEGGKPLTAEASELERKRLQDLSASAAEFAKHVKDDVSGKKFAADLIRLMPDAMTYTPAPGMADAHSPSGAQLIVLDFEPNPKWNPPSTTAEALTGLKGRVWIDASSGFVTRLDGEIFRSVNIGWGMLAHVYPGGKLSFEQVNVGGNRWIYSHFADQARVRALMLKTIDVSTEVSASDFQHLPGPLTFQQAIALLLQ